MVPNLEAQLRQVAKRRVKFWATYPFSKVYGFGSKDLLTVEQVAPFAEWLEDGACKESIEANS